MTEQEKINTLARCFDDVVWMAIRYAHSRHTYAPSMVRSAVNSFKSIFPDWEPKADATISAPGDDEIGGFVFRDDYLDDIVKTSK